MADKPRRTGSYRSRGTARQRPREVLIHPRAGEDRWLAVSRAPVPPSAGATEQRVVVNLHDISQLKAIDQMKSDFVAMVSHELRAPLTTVGGAVEMLGLLDPATDGGSYGEVVGILEQQTRRLRAVIEEVLQVTRLEAGRLPVRLRPLPLVAFLRALLERVRAEGGGDTRTVRLRVTDDETLVWADPAMLEIVLRNLLDNARKYTPAGSVVEVEVRDDPAAERVQVRVRDHGPGIPPDQRDRIFERFARGGRAGADEDEEERMTHGHEPPPTSPRHPSRRGGWGVRAALKHADEAGSQHSGQAVTFVEREAQSARFN